jgi:hypothetical protein
MTHADYDALVAASPQGSIFATSWWLDAVAGGRWRANTLSDGGGVVAAWPTVVRRTRWGDVHEGAPLTPYLGPLFRPRDSELKRREEEVKRLEQLAETLGSFAHIDAACNPAFDYWTPLRWHGFTQTTRYTWRFPRVDDLDGILSRARENIRREIRKAEKRGVTVEDGSLEAFQAVHLRTAAHQEIPGAELYLPALRRIDAAASDRNARRILLARDGDGRTHAGGYFVRDERWVYYLAGASDPELRTSGAPSLLLWKAIAYAAEEGLGFDFEGSIIRGVERFFRAFAGVPTPYSVVRKTPSRALRLGTPLKRALRSSALSRTRTLFSGV